MSGKHQSILLSMLLERSSEMDVDPPHTTISTPTTTTSADDLNENIGLLLSGIQVLNDDTEEHHVKILHAQDSLQSLSEDLSKVKISVEESNMSIKGCEPNQQILLQDFTSLKEDAENQKTTSYDGTFVWRITDVQKKMSMLSNFSNIQCFCFIFS
jgi:hypothetical protein